MGYGVLRSPWSLLVWLLGAFILTVGISVMAGVPFSKAAFTITGCLAVGGWICLVTPFSRVRIDESGIKYRGIFKFWSVSWAEISSVAVEERSGTLFSSSVPILRVVDDRIFQLTVLSGYSAAGRENRRVVDQVNRIQSVLNAIL